MRPTGIVRRIDELGRIVVPKELRRSLRIREGDSVEIFIDQDGSIVLKKYSAVAQMANVAGDMAESLAQSSGEVALICDRDVVVASAGAGEHNLIGRAIGRAVEKSMFERQVLRVHFSGGSESSSILIDDGSEFALISAAIAPIVADGDPVGAVVIGIPSHDRTIGDLEESLVVAAAGYIGRHAQ